MTAPVWTVLVRDPRHGPLPALLVVLTAVGGVIDAVSLLALGRIFVSNMTGNLVSVGLALAGAPGFVRETSVAAVGGFVVGATVAGHLVIRRGAHRGRLLWTATAVELVLVVVAAIGAIALDKPEGSLIAVTIAAILSIAMGIQNTVVRRLGVPDLPTTLLTMDLIGLVADEHGGGPGAWIRRSVAILSLCIGAFVGGVIVLRFGAAWALAVGALLIAAVLVGTLLACRRDAPWHAR